MLLRATKEHPVCRRLMTVPGVGAVVALTYATAIAWNRAWRTMWSPLLLIRPFRSISPEAYLRGVSPKISKSGDHMVRQALFQAALSLITRTQRWSALKAWGMGPVSSQRRRPGSSGSRCRHSTADAGARPACGRRRRSSGEIDRNGRISKSGDHMVRQALFQAALSLITRTASRVQRKSVPSLHSRCRSTASLRATATVARFRPCG
jgi:transposase